MEREKQGKMGGMEGRVEGTSDNTDRAACPSEHAMTSYFELSQFPKSSRVLESVSTKRTFLKALGDSFCGGLLVFESFGECFSGKRTLGVPVVGLMTVIELKDCLRFI
jgi:hypothetical protein